MAVVGTPLSQLRLDCIDELEKFVTVVFLHYERNMTLVWPEKRALGRLGRGILSGSKSRLTIVSIVDSSISRNFSSERGKAWFSSSRTKKTGRATLIPSIRVPCCKRVNNPRGFIACSDCLLSEITSKPWSTASYWSSMRCSCRADRRHSHLVGHKGLTGEKWSPSSGATVVSRSHLVAHCRFLSPVLLFLHFRFQLCCSWESTQIQVKRHLVNHSRLYSYKHIAYTTLLMLLTLNPVDHTGKLRKALTTLS